MNRNIQPARIDPIRAGVFSGRLEDQGGTRAFAFDAFDARPSVDWPMPVRAGRA